MLDINYFSKESLKNATIEDLELFTIDLEQAIVVIKNQLLAYRVDGDIKQDWYVKAKSSLDIKKRHLSATNKILLMKKTELSREKNNQKTREHYFFQAAKQMLSNDEFNKILSRGYEIKEARE